jgi:hypothetical protein
MSKVREKFLLSWRMVTCVHFSELIDMKNFCFSVLQRHINFSDHSFQTLRWKLMEKMSSQGGLKLYPLRKTDVMDYRECIWSFSFITENRNFSNKKMGHDSYCYINNFINKFFLYKNYQILTLNYVLAFLKCHNKYFILKEKLIIQHFFIKLL